MWIYVIAYTSCESVASGETPCIALIIVYILRGKIDSSDVNVSFRVGHFRNQVNHLLTCQYQSLEWKLLLFNKEGISSIELEAGVVISVRQGQPLHLQAKGQVENKSCEENIDFLM